MCVGIGLRAWVAIVVGLQRKLDGVKFVGKTYKDRKDYDPTNRKRKKFKRSRGCAIHGKKDCEWCLNNLQIQTRKANEFAKDLEDDPWSEPESE